MYKIFKNKYNEVRSGWAIACGAAFFFLYIILSQTLNQFIPNGLLPIKSVLLGIFQTVCMLYILHLFYKKPLYAMGFSKNHIVRSLFYGAFLGLLSISLVFTILLVTNNISIIDVNFTQVLTYGFFSSFLFSLSTAISEETLFRSYIMTSLKTTRSKYAIVIISSVIFFNSTWCKSRNRSSSIY